MNAQAIAEALELKRNGKGWRGPCPVCGGDNRSTKFSIKDGDNGTPLVKCFAGCTFKQLSGELRSRGLWQNGTPYQYEKSRREKTKRDIEHAGTILMIAESDRAAGRTLSPQDEEMVEQANDSVAMAVPSAGFKDTDMANAERFARLHGDHAFCTPERGWLIWDDKRWQVDEQHRVMELAKQTARKMFSEIEHVEKNQQKGLFEWARRSQAKDRLQAMLTLAQSEPGIPARLTDFDATPLLLNCGNGIVNLASGELIPHSPVRMLSKITPVHYDPTASCPLWLEFLDRVMASDDDMVEFLQRAAGYTLTGNTGEQCLFFTHGCGANGKSVFLEVLLQLAGEYGCNARADSFMVKTHGGIPNDIARLCGMRFVGVNETEIGQRMAESLVKDLTGGDTISARFLHKEYFDFRPTFKLWMRGNHKPNIRGTDDGIWRRIFLIPFEVQIPEAERDPNLPAKLRAELSGILRWAVEGAIAWQRDGLKVPDKVRAATSEYRTEMDRLAEFIDEKCITGATFSGYGGDLYNAYTDWCAESSDKPMSQMAFGLALVERGFDRIKTSGRKKYFGIGLRADDYQEAMG